MRRVHKYADCVDQLREGDALEILVKGGDMVAEKRPLVELAVRLAADQSVHTLIWQIDRVGTLMFSTRLEHEIYPPADQARNRLFRPYTTKWQGIVWQLASYPAEDQAAVDKLIADCRLRKANGVPTLLYRQAGGDRFRMIGVINREQPLEPDCERFPVFGPRVWTLENAKDSPVYHGDATRRSMARQELEDVERFLATRGARANDRDQPL